MNRYPSDDADDFASLRRRVEELEALLRAQAALTEASQGWIFTDMSAPATPTAGKTHIYSQSGRLRARSTTDDVGLFDIPQGTAVADADNTLTNPPSSYVQAQIQTIVDSCDSAIVQFNALLASLRAAGIIAS